MIPAQFQRCICRVTICHNTLLKILLCYIYKMIFLVTMWPRIIEVKRRKCENLNLVKKALSIRCQILILEKNAAFDIKAFNSDILIYLQSVMNLMKSPNPDDIVLAIKTVGNLGFIEFFTEVKAVIVNKELPPLRRMQAIYCTRRMYKYIPEEVCLQISVTENK